MWRSAQQLIYLCHRDHGCRVPKRNHMERKCWSSREAQSRAAGEEGTLGALGSTIQITSTPNYLREITSTRTTRREG